MGSFGWAYVDCSGSADGAASGPLHSVQFKIAGGDSSGSVNLLYRKNASRLMLTGAMWVSGAIHADNYYIKNRMELNVTGSTYFGDDNTDVHVRTGSLSVSNTSNVRILDVANSTQTVAVRAFKGMYTGVSTRAATASVPSYILGITQTSSVNVLIPSASLYGAGAIIMVKDEVAARGGKNITLHSRAGYTIDNSLTYILTGSMPAISLYSNGTNWFVF